MGGAGNHFEQGAFARAIDANDAHCLARVNLEVEVLQYPMQVVAWGAARHHPFGQARPAIGVLFVGFAQIGNGDGTHISLALSDLGDLENGW